MSLSKMIFDAWMEKYHPNFLMNWGIVFILVGLGIFTGMILSIWYAWWWKVCLIGLGVLAFAVFIFRSWYSTIIEDFKYGNKKL